MSARTRLAVLVLLVLAIPAQQASAAKPPSASAPIGESSGGTVGPFDIAITVDDLPAHGSLTSGMTRAEIAREQIAALKAHKVPEAYGFVNAVHVSREPGSEAVLEEWRSAGFPLGNHTYSHKNVNEGSVDAFEADILADEPVLHRYMPQGHWHFLRFPYLSAGDAAHHDGVMAWLKEHRYRIADVSVSFDDWVYTEPYNRCVAKSDTAAIEKLKVHYLEGVDASILRMKALSLRVYGRLIPQVLLTHIGGFSSVMLPETLDRLTAAGAHYVTLEQAESDPAYAETDPRAGDGTLMERIAAEKGIDISTLPIRADNGAVVQMCR